MPPLPPDCSLDYIHRPFSLPFGVPPALSKANQDVYYQNIQCQTLVLSYRGQTAASDDPLNPGTPFSQKFKSITGSVNNPIVTYTLGLPGTVGSTPVALTPAQINAVGKQNWTPVTALPGKTLAESEAARFPWDTDARKVSALPQPLWAEESVLAYWMNPGAGSGLLAAPIAGVFSDDDSTHALATSTTQQDGELLPTLLRAPVIGLVRFQRYRHILSLAGNRLQVDHPSSAGAIVLQAFPTIVPSGTNSPLFSENWVIFENADGEAAGNNMAALAYIQLLKFDDIWASQGFKKPLIKQCRWMLSTWLAYLEVIYPVKNPSGPDLLSGISAALKGPFQREVKESQEPVMADLKEQIGDLWAFIKGQPNLKSNLIDYIRRYYAPVLCGKSWHELEVDIPKEPRPPQGAANINLESLPQAKDTWLVCYAGCPLSQAAALYLSDPAHPPAIGDLPFQAMTVFELEALAIAGKTKELYPAITEPTLADQFKPIPLDDFASKSLGKFASLRLIQKGKPAAKYAILDWLSEIIKGSNFGMQQAPQIDLRGLSPEVHPLREALDLDGYELAMLYRQALDTLNNATVGGVRLDSKILNWWLNKTDLAIGNKWPSGISGGPVEPRDAGPKDPFISGETKSDASASSTGFDVFDLEAVLVAQRMVRNPKDPISDIPVALFLALLQTEGYRYLGTTERKGILEADGWKLVGKGPVPPLAEAFRKEQVDPAISAKPFFLEGIAAMDWVRYPFGLDIFNRGVAGAQDAFAASKTAFIQRMNTLKSKGSIDNSFNAYYAHAYLVHRLQGRYKNIPPYNDVIQIKRTTRRVQWLGILCQQAEFQTRHKLLSEAATVDNVQVSPVDELLSPVSPIPGSQANSPERRAYIAYYALIYLFFNAGPGIWNAWVQKAKQTKPAGGTVSEYLLYSNHIGTPMGCADYQRANMLRFAVALDAYLRMDLAGNQDTNNPEDRNNW